MLQVAIKAVLVMLITCAAALTSHAERPPLTQERIAKIDAFVEARMAELKVPGISMALIENGEVVHSRGFGVIANDGAAITAETRFQIGSVTKPFTALTLLQMVDAGTLKLDDTVVQHLPDFRTRNKAQSDKITVRHLLSHRSGLSSKIGNRNQHIQDQSHGALEATMLELRSAPLIAEPGAVYQYSNANYQTLGLLIETLEDAPLEEVFKYLITQPGSLTNTKFGPSSTPASDLAIGHRYWLSSPKPYQGQMGRALFAQGGVETSAADLAAVVTRLIEITDPVLSDPLAFEMITPVETGPGPHYALGWMVRDFPDHRLVFHTGRNPGFEAIAGFSPDQKFGFVVLANANNSLGNRHVDGLTRGVGNLVMGLEPPAIPAVTASLPVWILAAIPLGLIGFILGFIWKWRNIGFKPLERKPWQLFWRLILPSALLLTLSWALYYGLPAMNGANFAAANIFNPDVGTLLLSGSCIALGWAIVRPLFRLTLAK